MENTNVIYCYVKKDTQEVVYVGQTVDLNRRRLQHEKYDPFNPIRKERYCNSHLTRQDVEEIYDLILNTS